MARKDNEAIGRDCVIALLTDLQDTGALQIAVNFPDGPPGRERIFSRNRRCRAKPTDVTAKG